MAPSRLVLASGSAYRRALLARLRVPFEWRAPDVDESPLRGEAPAKRAARLAADKAGALREAFPAACIVGSDQVAVCAGGVLGKPGSARDAREQLERCAGQCVEFFTAACLIDPGSELMQTHVDRTVVHLRKLSAAQIERYVALDEPYDCAGAFKAESLGIALFERADSSDPTALIGLPLIWLAAALTRAGIEVP